MTDVPRAERGDSQDAATVAGGVMMAPTPPPIGQPAPPSSSRAAHGRAVSPSTSNSAPMMMGHCGDNWGSAADPPSQDYKEARGGCGGGGGGPPTQQEQQQQEQQHHMHRGPTFTSTGPAVMGSPPQVVTSRPSIGSASRGISTSGGGGGHRVSNKDLRVILAFVDWFYGTLFPPRKYFPNFYSGQHPGASTDNFSGASVTSMAASTSTVTEGGGIGTPALSLGVSGTVTSLGGLDTFAPNAGPGPGGGGSGHSIMYHTSWSHPTQHVHLSPSASTTSASAVAAGLAGSLEDDVHLSSAQAPGPAKLSTFEVLRVLGAGVSGTVLLVRDLADDLLYSFKCTKFSSSTNLSTRHRRRRERAISEADCIDKCCHFSIIASYKRFYGAAPGTAAAAANRHSARPESGGARESPDTHSKMVARVREAVERSKRHSQDEEPHHVADDHPDVPAPGGVAAAPSHGTGAGEEDSSSGKEDTVLGIVMELADSGDLRQELKHRRQRNHYFRPIQAGLLFAQLLLAVQHMHSRNIYHRDLKPANVLMDHSGLLKVGDFGFAKQVDDGEQEEDFLGTAYYIAPEIWQRQRYGKAVDIYALGVILYEILMLKRPFTGGSLQAIQRAALQGQFQEPTIYLSLSAARHPLCREEVDTFACLTTMMTAMMHRNPEKRPTADQLMHTHHMVGLCLQLVSAVNNNPLISRELRIKISHDVTKVLPASIVNEDPRQSLSLSGPHPAGGNQSPRNADGSGGAQSAIVGSHSILSIDDLLHHNKRNSRSESPVGSGAASAGGAGQGLSVVCPGGGRTSESKRVIIVHQEGAVLKESGQGRWKIRYVVIRTVVHHTVIPRRDSDYVNLGGSVGSTTGSGGASTATTAAFGCHMANPAVSGIPAVTSAANSLSDAAMTGAAAGHRQQSHHHHAHAPAGDLPPLVPPGASPPHHDQSDAASLATVSSTGTARMVAFHDDSSEVQLVMGVVREDIDMQGKHVSSSLADFTRCVAAGPAEYDGRENVFCIQSDKWRTLTFQAATSEEREQWIQTINMLCGAADSTTTTTTITGGTSGST